MFLEWYSPWILAGLIAAIAVRWSMHRARRWGLVDEANHRSLHVGSTPRTGGLGVIVGVGAGWLAAGLLGHPPAHWLSLTLAGGGVAFVSLLDDAKDMPALPRFTIHILVGLTPTLAGFGWSAFAIPGVTIALGPVASAITTLVFVVWFINLYNFMDGMDGFAGGMALCGFAGLAALGFIHGNPGFALAAFTVSASAAGFLWFNFPPARVFMGDAGAATLGFLAAAFILWSDAAKIAPLWIGVMIFSPFYLDATVTLFSRLFRRERFWRPHKSHYYQRLVSSGWSHRRTVIAEYILMVGCGATAVAIAGAAVWIQWLAVAAWLGVYCGGAAAVNSRERALGS